MCDECDVMHNITVVFDSGGVGLRISGAPYFVLGWRQAVELGAYLVQGAVIRAAGEGAVPAVIGRVLQEAHASASRRAAGMLGGDLSPP